MTPRLRLARLAGHLIARLPSRDRAARDLALKSVLAGLGHDPPPGTVPNRPLAASYRREARVVARLDPVRFCRHLSLAGWELLPSAGTVPGTVVVSAPLGSPEVLARALELYRPSWRARPPWVSSPPPPWQDLSAALTSGAWLGCLLPARPGRGLSRPPEALTAAASTPGATVVPAFAYARGGGWRLQIHSPLTSQGSEGEAEAMLGQLVAVVENELRHHPEHWRMELEP